MLKPCVRAAAGLALAAFLVGGRASADNVDDDDLRMPQRLTVGVADDLLGQLGPDGKMLYFVSNRDTTSELFAQSLVDGHAWQLFDDGADVTWPRVSPDGRSLLYISFRESASGQLCVRRLPEGDGRRCLQDSFAALQAEWIDRDRIALVSRRSVQGDLRLLEVTTGSQLVGAVTSRSEHDQPGGLARRALARVCPGRAGGADRGTGVRCPRGPGPRGDSARVGLVGPAGEDRPPAPRTDRPACVRQGRPLAVRGPVLHRHEPRRHGRRKRPRSSLPGADLVHGGHAGRRPPRAAHRDVVELRVPRTVCRSADRDMLAGRKPRRVLVAA